MNAYTEGQVKKIMMNLQCTREEAIEIIEADKSIDKGEKLFELSDEQKKVAKAMTTAGGGKHKAHKPREQKVDRDKRDLMDAIDDACCCVADNVKDRTSDSELKLTYNDVEYTVKLIKHRKGEK